MRVRSRLRLLRCVFFPLVLVVFLFDGIAKWWMGWMSLATRWAEEDMIKKKKRQKKKIRGGEMVDGIFVVTRDMDNGILWKGDINADGLMNTGRAPREEEEP